MAKGYNPQVYEVAYTTLAELNAASSKTFVEGDIITDADITAATGLAWQQLAITGAISDNNFVVEPLESEQYGEHSRGNITVKGFENPNGFFTINHYPGISTVHKKIIEAGLGKEVANSGHSGQTASDTHNSTTVDLVAGHTLDSSDEGLFVAMGSEIGVIEDITGDVMTLKYPITASAGVVAIVKNHFNPDELSEDVFILFVRTEKDAYLVSFVRFAVDFETPKRSLFQLKFNYQGDVPRPSTLTMDTLGTLTSEANTKAITTTAFKRIKLGSSPDFCLNNFNLKLTREQQRLDCQATESLNNNGGTFQDKYMFELDVTTYDNNLRTNYDNNDYISIFAQRGDLAFYSQGGLIKNENPTTINDNVLTTTYEIGANVDMQTQPIIYI